MFNCDGATDGPRTRSPTDTRAPTQPKTKRPTEARSPTRSRKPAGKGESR